MSQSTLPMTPGMTGKQRGPIVVEMSTKQLPARMRLGGLRSAVGLPALRAHGFQRAVMVPVALVTRFLSR